MSLAISMHYCGGVTGLCSIISGSYLTQSLLETRAHKYEYYASLDCFTWACLRWFLFEYSKASLFVAVEIA